MTQERRGLSLSIAPFATDGGDGKPIPREKAEHLVRWAHLYALDPWAGHVIIMYGRPFITAEGALARARANPRYEGYTLRALEEAEKEELGVPKDAWAYECAVIVKGDRHPIVEWGVVTREEVEEAKARAGERARFLPIVKAPWAQAQARAIRRAHLRAFPLDRPKGEIPVVSGGTTSRTVDVATGRFPDTREPPRPPAQGDAYAEGAP